MIRIQLELPEERVRELEALMSEVGLRTKKDLFNNALTLLEWAVKERKAGHVIASVDERENRIRQIVMPVLESVIPAKTESTATVPA